MDYTLISRYLSGKASEEEVKSLFDWIDQDQGNKEALMAIKKMWAIASNEEEDLELVWSDFKRVINRKKRKHRIAIISRYAAVLIGILIASIFYFRFQSAPNTEIPIDENAITLKLEDGNIEVINEKGEHTIYNNTGSLVGKQQGTKLVYSSPSEKNTTEKLVYNELTVPYGKTFLLVLSDGSTVHLNAGSSIKYPIRFLQQGPREVFLNGEAFFEVNKDSLHSFIVNTNKLNVEVLGTKFNISSYSEDEIVETVLVEGSVRLENKKSVANTDDFTILKPGQKAEWNERKITVDKVDTSIYTAWIDGKIVFRNTPFRIIRKRLERHYNITIHNNNASLDERTYNATFDIETINQVLKTLNENSHIEYSIEDNHITIN